MFFLHDGFTRHVGIRPALNEAAKVLCGVGAVKLALFALSY